MTYLVLKLKHEIWIKIEIIISIIQYSNYKLGFWFLIEIVAAMIKPRW